MPDIAEIGVRVDTSGLKSGEAAFNEFREAGARAAQGLDGFEATANRALRRNGTLGVEAERTARAVRGGLQNVAFQIQDIATQLTLGTNATIVFAQQLPQLLGGFGVYGAAAGAAVAIIGGLVAAFDDGAEAAKKFEKAQDDLSDSLKRLNDFSTSKLDELVKKYGTLDERIRNTIIAQVTLNRLDAQLSARTLITGLQRRLEGDVLDLKAANASLADLLNRGLGNRPDVEAQGFFAGERLALAELFGGEASITELERMRDAVNELKAATTFEQQTAATREFTEAFIAAGGAANEKVLDLAKSVISSTLSIDEYDQAIADAEKGVARFEQGLGPAADKVKKLSAEQRKAAKDSAKFAEELIKIARTMAEIDQLDFSNSADVSRIEALIKFLETRRDFEAGITRAILKMRLESADNASAIEDYITHTADVFEDSLGDMLDGTKSVSQGFRDMTTQILKDTARLIFQKTVLDGLTESLSKLFQELLRVNSLGGSSGGGGSIFGNILGSLGSALAGGIGSYFGFGGVSLSNTGNAFGSAGSLFNPNTGAIALPYASAKGNVFSNGDIVPFENGGVPSLYDTITPFAKGEIFVDNLSEKVVPFAKGETFVDNTVHEIVPFAKGEAFPKNTGDSIREVIPFAKGEVFSSESLPPVVNQIQIREVIPFAKGEAFPKTTGDSIREVIPFAKGEAFPKTTSNQVVPFAKGEAFPKTTGDSIREVIPFAKGGVSNSNPLPTLSEVVPYGRGDVITAPTFFQMNNRKTGLMAEEKEEAIVPLSRNAKGELGVSSVRPVVNIEVINQSSSQVEVQQKGNGDVTMIIKNVVSQDIINGGPIGKSIRSVYGLSPTVTKRG